MGRVDLGNLDPSAHLLSLSESLVRHCLCKIAPSVVVLVLEAGLGLKALAVTALSNVPELKALSPLSRLSELGEKC